MKLFIDCEWNDYKGDLISIAIVSADGHEFYEVLACPSPSSWISENVIPHLAKAPIKIDRLQEKLAGFLAGFVSIHVIADWPEDVARFCDLLVVGPGKRLDTPPLTCEVIRTFPYVPSVTPHNALSDARAIRDGVLSEVDE